MVLFNGFSSAVLKHIIFICEKVEKVKRWKIKQKGESFNLWPRASNGCESQEKAWLGRERERERERREWESDGSTRCFPSLDKMKTNSVKMYNF